MAENTEEAVTGPDLNPDLRSSFQWGSSVKYFERKIDFVPARKPFNGLMSGGADFKIETLNPGRPDPNSGLVSVQEVVNVNGKVKKGAVSDAFDGSLDPEPSLEVSFQRIGAGLENLGNTCFLNSVLQCLTYTEPLAAYLQSGKHQSSCRINGFCTLCAIQKHVSHTLRATGRILAPKDLVANLRCISRNFRNARQEDAHEYMVNLLEAMHKCCLPSGVQSESPGAYKKSLVHKIFGGCLRSQVKCLQCNNCSNRFDPFVDLSLEIVKADSLKKAISHFTAPEQLDGGERQYQCQKCKQKVRALKQLTIHKAPYVLTIHLKRFHFHDPGQKINRNVNFDTTLDLKPFVSGPYEGDLKYSLYGVLVHHGWSTHSGHYYCYVRTSTNMWYSLDDNQVRQVNESTVLQQKAYMLFYVQSRNSTPRKPVEAAQKENWRESNYSGNRASSFPFSQSTSSTVQVSLTNKCSATVSSSSSFSSSVITKEAISVQSLKEFEVMESVPTDSGKLGTSLNANHENKIVKNDADGDSVEGSTISNGSGETCAEQMMGHETAGKVFTGNMSYAIHGPGKNKFPVIKNASNNFDSASPANHKSSQVGDTSAPVVEKTSGVVQHVSHVLTGASTMSCGSLQVEAMDCQGSKNFKKKHLKFQFANVHFGSNILLRASLGLHKKCVKRKHRVIKKDHVTYDLGPSTSQGQESVSSDRKRRVKSCIRKGMDKMVKREEMNANGGPSTDAVNADKEVIEKVKDCKNDTMENGLMSMLTRGLEETLVAHWDGVDLPPSLTRESHGEEIAIGYVLDEWDEEYDRGKRKRVKRSKHDFGGPNHFQEVASRKMKSKKARLDRASAGNCPLRI